MFDPAQQHRRSIRLPHYDYAQAGAYFITIVTYQRELLFDDPVLHQVIETFWQRIPRHVLYVKLDTFVVMPNHFHGILWLINADLVSAARDVTPPSQPYLLPDHLAQLSGISNRSQPGASIRYGRRPVNLHGNAITMNASSAMMKN